jgi:hypothetical protein
MNVSSPQRRPFTLLDLMILVAGAALAFTALRAFGSPFRMDWRFLLSITLLALASGSILVGPLVF